MQSENEAYAALLCSHLGAMIGRLRAIPADKWDWAPAPPAPSARAVAEHTLVWLIADRQHLREPDVTLHARTPAPAAKPEALCDALEAEKTWWNERLLALTPDQFAEERFQFGLVPFGVRSLVVHITQQIIYKSGQLSTLFFALGLDGEEVYTALFPNDGYDSVAELARRPIHNAILRDNVEELRALLAREEKPSFVSAAGHTPLKLAVMRNRAEMATLLLEHGADCDETDPDNNTSLACPSFFGYPEIVDLLPRRGADFHKANRWNATPLGLARMQKHEEITRMLEQAGATE